MTRVLIDAVLRIALFVLPATALVVALVLGSEHAVGVLVGFVLALGDSLGIIYLAGELLDPNSKGNKGLMFAVLFLKLALVGGLLWASLSLWGVSGLGIILGIGAALCCLVIGVSRGSSSPAGQRAIAEAEAKIQEEMGQHDLEDKDSNSG